MCKFSRDSKVRLGNILIYIALHGHRPCKTKVLKLLYLMEEKSALVYHVPFTGLPFEVWQHGPVEKDVFVELSDGPSMFGEYVSMVSGPDGGYLAAVKDFDEEEFSDAELRMMRKVMEEHGGKSASELVRLTHQAGSPWHRTASAHGLLEAFSRQESNSSNVVIDFADCLAPCDAEFYKEMKSDLDAANLYGA